MNEKRNIRRWGTTLCAAALCLLCGLPAWGQDNPTVTRVAGSNTDFTFTMPDYNVKVTVEYVDAGAKITKGETTLFYETLAEAFAVAADNDEITLLIDQTLSETVTISKSITLNLNGKTISKTGAEENLTGLNVTGSLTITGAGTISGFGTAINNSGTLTLNSLPTFSGNTAADIELAASKVITIGEGFPTEAPEGYTPIKVKVAETNPLTITSGFGIDRGNPEQFFNFVDVTRTIRLKDGEAELVTYTELSAFPNVANNSTHDDGVWIGDEMTTSTTAQPSVIKWYYADDIENGAPKTGATALTAEADPADGSKYIVKTADLGKQIVAVFTQPKDIAGTGHPAETIVKASAATATVVKKDNLGTLTEATFETETIDEVAYVDYNNVNVTNASTGVEYMVIASDAADVTENSAYWSKAVTPTDGNLLISQYVAIENGEAVLKNMKPGTEYKLYYRLKETEDTKHGTTATTNGKPGNEKNVAITTRTFDYKVTIQGVTYLFEDDTNPETAATAKIIGLPAEDDTNHAGHKTAHAYPTIAKPQIDSQILDIFSVIGYNIADETQVTGFDGNMNISSVGNAIGSYGCLIIDHEDLYNSLKNNGTAQASPEGYQIFNYNSGEAYFVLGKTVENNNVEWEKAEKNNGLTDKLTDALNAVYEGGSVAFYDLDDAVLPTGTSGDNNGKTVAAQGQTVKVVVELPVGFEFKSGKNVVTVQDVAGDVTLEAGEGVHAGKYVGTFTMPESATVSFKETDIIQGRQISTYTPPATSDAVTVTPDGSNPTELRVNQPMVYTFEPLHVTEEGKYYALTSLGLPEGVTATIVDDEDGSTPVELPTEKKVKVTLTVTPTFTDDELTFAPVMAVCAEDITIVANGTSTYYDTKGLKLGANVTGITLATVTAVSETTVTVEDVENNAVPANTPFFIQNTSDATSVRIEIDNAISTISVAPEFKGTAEGTTLTLAEGTKCYGFNGADFVWLKEGGSVATHRCWLEINGSTGARLTVNWPDGSTTGINGLSADDAEDGEWYDLNGRKLQSKPNRKGVYIKNGQKKVVK